MNWLYIFLGFSLLIILHEGGHFLAAKATGMRCACSAAPGPIRALSMLNRHATMLVFPLRSG